jgi:hypothetical protein
MTALLSPSSPFTREAPYQVPGRLLFAAVDLPQLGLLQGDQLVYLATMDATIEDGPAERMRVGVGPFIVALRGRRVPAPAGHRQVRPSWWRPGVPWSPTVTEWQLLKSGEVAALVSMIDAGEWYGLDESDPSAEWGGDDSPPALSHPPLRLLK